MSDDDHEPTQRTRASDNTLDPDELDKMAHSLVRLALFSENSRDALSRETINKLILHEHSRQFPKIFEKANNILKDTFGMEMEETYSKTTTKAAEPKRNNKYILRSTLENNERAKYIEWTNEETFQMAFLTITLSLILTSGKKLYHQALNSLLRKIDSSLDIDKEYKEIIDKFCSLGYLDKFKIDPRDEDVVYIWGTRSKILYTEESVIKFMAGLYRDVTDAKRAALIVGIERAVEGI